MDARRARASADRDAATLGRRRPRHGAGADPRRLCRPPGHARRRHRRRMRTRRAGARTRRTVLFSRQAHAGDTTGPCSHRAADAAALAVTFALTLTWLVPSLGLDSRAAERAVLALVAIGITTVATRRATLFQIIGIVLVENALALAALELPGGASLAIELGVALDLILVALVAGVFHERIFLEFGAGDTAALRTLRD